MSSTEAPAATVVMATYGRGRHIVPSIRSALAQTFDDFELLVVGDHSTDETARAVQGIRDPRLRWVNLPQRIGSQSGPNNAGIVEARGQVIAYLGHDDIWEPFHLQDLMEVLAARPEVDFAVGGAIFHLPGGIPGSWVTGIFEEDSTKNDHFFPPSSFGHRRSVCDRIGLWKMPMEITAPVDADFLLRAARAGLGFASTGRISVHKFAAGHRYLSYVEQESEEQQAMLDALSWPDHAPRIARIVEEAREGETFMIVRHGNYDQFAPGELARQNMTRKGLLKAEAHPLGRGAVLHQNPSNCALDWEDEPRDGIRWTRATPAPRLLLPFTATGPVAVAITVAHADRDALRGLVLSCKGKTYEVPLDAPVRNGAHWAAIGRTILTLRRDGPSILQFHLKPEQRPHPPVPGLGVGDITLTPLGPMDRLRRLFRREAMHAVRTSDIGEFRGYKTADST